MYKSDKPCKATSIFLESMEVKHGPNGLSLVVVSHLADNNGMRHGTNTFVGPWSENIVTSLGDLILGIEEEIAKIHFDFEGEENARTNTGTEQTDKPKGLLGAKLGGAEDTTPQI
jgi:hypothetical protein